MSNTNNNFNILLVTSALLFFAGTAVQAWDLGVVTQNQIQFFTDDVVDKTVDIPLGRMKAMAFDPIKRDLYVRGNNNEFGGIFRIKLTGDHATIAVIEPIIDKQPYQIHGMAFNEQTSTLYWSTGNVGTINYVHVPENGTKDLLKGRVLLWSEPEQSLFKLAVDVCRGYIYWINELNIKHYKIERSRMDGSERRDLINVKSYINDMVIDVERNMMYWISGSHSPSKFNVECSELDGGFRRTLYSDENTEMNFIAVYAGNIYWANQYALYNFDKINNKMVKNIKPRVLAVFIYQVDLLIASTRGTMISINNTCVVIKNKKPVVTQPLTPVQKLMICRKNGIFLTNGTCICNPGFDGKYCQLQIAQPKMSSSALVLCPCLVLCIFTLLNYYYTILFGTTVV